MTACCPATIHSPRSFRVKANSTYEENDMSRGMPSMVALLGLLAVAGYQNRDKISEMLGGLRGAPAGAPGTNPAGGMAGQSGQLSAQPGGQGGILGSLGGLLGGASAGSVLSGGLGQLIDHFRQNGQGQTADSWVSTGANHPVNEGQLAQALGPDVLNTLSQHTGLSRDELLSRLSRELPNAVDQMTPEGRLPTEAEAARQV
jgi:uncharacterized protein YidB (DUF937 family)